MAWSLVCCIIIYLPDCVSRLGNTAHWGGLVQIPTLLSSGSSRYPSNIHSLAHTHRLFWTTLEAGPKRVLLSVLRLRAPSSPRCANILSPHCFYLVFLRVLAGMDFF